MNKIIILITLVALFLTSSIAHSVGDDGSNGDKLYINDYKCYKVSNDGIIVYEVGDDGSNGIEVGDDGSNGFKIICKTKNKD